MSYFSSYSEQTRLGFSERSTKAGSNVTSRHWGSRSGSYSSRERICQLSSVAANFKGPLTFRLEPYFGWQLLNWVSKKYLVVVGAYCQRK